MSAISRWMDGGATSAGAPAGGPAGAGVPAPFLQPASRQHQQTVAAMNLVAVIRDSNKTLAANYANYSRIHAFAFKVYFDSFLFA
jgi:hypothetical protein